MTSNFRIAAVILGAGASIRMGRPKMLLPWGRTSVIGHIVNLWRMELEAVQVGIVIAPAPCPMSEELDRLCFPESDRIVNSCPERGMFSSVQTASAWQGWRSDITHFALILGDQPQIMSTTLKTLLESVRDLPATIHQPSRNKRPKHPIVFPSTDFRDIAKSQSDTLRTFLNPKKRTFVEIDEPSLEVDLDYPADYEAALKLADPASLRCRTNFGV